jgi:hypothetical protein
MAMQREVFDRAVIMESHCRLRASSILPVIDALKLSPVCLAAAKSDAGVKVSSRLMALERSDAALTFLDALSSATNQSEGSLTAGLNRVVSSGALRGKVTFGALGREWLPEESRPGTALPAVEVRRGNVRRLYAEMLMFAMHRLVSSDMKRAAAIYARVALASRPDLPQLGAARLVEHMTRAFAERAPGMSGRNRDQLHALLKHAAEEDPAGNLLGIAALHLEMGQMKTALAVLRMVYTMRFNKPVPVPD